MGEQLGVPERIREVCEYKSLTIKDLSNRTGVSYRTIQNYIGGDRAVGSEFLTAISTHLGISASWVLTGEGPMSIPLPSSEQPVQPIEPEQGGGPSGRTDSSLGSPGHVIPADSMRLMFCSGVVTEEYANNGIEMSKEAHLLETLWVYNKMMSQLPDPTDGVAMEIALGKTLQELRQHLAIKAG